MNARSKKVSLSDELSSVRMGLDGIRLLCFAYLEEQVGREQDARQAPRVISALAGLLSARLRSVERVLTGQADPRTILTTDNDVTCVDESETADVVLREWSDAEHAEHAAEELASAERRLERAKGARGSRGKRSG